MIGMASWWVANYFAVVMNIAPLVIAYEWPILHTLASFAFVKVNLGAKGKAACLWTCSLLFLLFFLLGFMVYGWPLFGAAVSFRFVWIGLLVLLFLVPALYGLWLWRGRERGERSEKSQ